MYSCQGSSTVSVAAPAAVKAQQRLEAEFAPREAELAAHIVQRAEAKGLAARLDEKGNVYLYKPAVGAGMEHKAGVILQAHIDMVAQKTPDSPHDFERDPIRTHIEDGWVYADNTTLGADNGMLMVTASGTAVQIARTA